MRAFRSLTRNHRATRLADVPRTNRAGTVAAMVLLRSASVGACLFVSGVHATQTCNVPTAVASIPAPTNARQMVYSPAQNRLVIRNSGSAIATVDVATGQSTLRFSNTNFVDIGISPGGRYVFGADYGGENIGYGSPASPQYVHRLDLSDNTWETRTVYIAGGIEVVSDDQFILKSNDQWVTFTNNLWGAGPAAVTLNSSSGYSGPAYYASVYRGDFRYDVHTGRLLHGSSGLSSDEIQAFKLVGNDFVRQEGSGIYGSAQDQGGGVAIATDGSAFYYGQLQVDALDVSFNRRVFSEQIYAATGSIAFGNGKLFDAHTGDLVSLLGFDTTVYALNPNGQDFWAFDPGQSQLRYFTFSDVPCTTPPAPVGVSAAFNYVSKNFAVSWIGVSGATSYKIYFARQAGVTKANYASLGGQARTSTASPYVELTPPAGTYYVVVTAINDAGESLESHEATVNVPDYLPPSVPTGLTATPLDGSSVRLSWTASSDNVNVQNYRLYRDGNLVSAYNFGQLSYVDTGLRGLTTYSYTLSACDDSYNCSAQSASVSVTTPARTTPDPFTFGYSFDVPRNALVISNSITVTGLDTSASISIIGGSYSIDGGEFTTAAGTVNNGQSIRVRVLSGSQIWDTTTATLNIGGVTASFTARTGPLKAVAVQSRGTHGGVDHDIPLGRDLPLGDAITTEPRIIGSGHRIVFQFDGLVTIPGTAGILDENNNPVGNATASINPIASHEVLVKLNGVSDNQRVIVRLNGVDYYTNVSVPIGFLVGDINNSRSVNGSDISGAKARSGPVNALNFKADVNSDGFIDAADVSLIKSRAGWKLP